MSATQMLLSSSDAALVGNWHPFPPPEVGFYDLRQAVPGPDGDPQQYFFYFPNRRVYATEIGRLLCMNRRVTRMRPEQGWQFRFRPGPKKSSERWRPYVVIYGPVRLPNGVEMRAIRREDASQQLPIACCREEALYIVRSMPERWPAFRQIHVEYTPEVLQ